MGFHEVWAIFQPHTFSRTAMLLDDFAKALTIPDHVIVSEILPVRETNTYHIYAEDLVKKVPGAVYRKTFPEITDYVIEKAKPGDLILTLGGGDVYKCANQIVKRYQEKA
jgi:UDP-N-acetylmuramate--alanine ligase